MPKYIDKDALVAEIKRLDEFWHLSKDAGGQVFIESLLSFLYTIEVKEVDLEKEINNYVNEHFSECGDGVLISDANSLELTLFDIIPMAKHFFELGLKAKGE